MREIRQMAVEDRLSAARIWEALDKKYDDVPNVRTIQRVVGELLPPDETAAWSPIAKGVDPEEARLVLPVVGWLAMVTQGRRRTVTLKEATAIAKVRRMASPQLTFRGQYAYAISYITREARGDSVADLDLSLAMIAWATSVPEWVDQRERFAQAEKAGLKFDLPDIDVDELVGRGEESDERS